MVKRTPVWFHNHLDDCNCKFLNISEDCRHAVYINPVNNRKFSILKDADEMLPETVVACCYILEIPLPDGSDTPLTHDEFIAEMSKPLN